MWTDLAETGAPAGQLLATGVLSLLTALLSHDCAMAVPIAKEVIKAARTICFIVSSFFIVLKIQVYTV